jgi:hypothetical protein
VGMISTFLLQIGHPFIAGPSSYLHLYYTLFLGKIQIQIYRLLKVENYRKMRYNISVEKIKEDLYI